MKILTIVLAILAGLMFAGLLIWAPQFWSLKPQWKRLAIIGTLCALLVGTIFAGRAIEPKTVEVHVDATEVIDGGAADAATDGG